MILLSVGANTVTAGVPINKYSVQVFLLDAGHDLHGVSETKSYVCALFPICMYVHDVKNTKDYLMMCCVLVR